MPGCSGQELAQRIARIQPRIKVVFVTGFADDVDVSQVQLMVPPSLLQKPITADALVEAVRAQQHRALPSQAAER